MLKLFNKPSTPTADAQWRSCADLALVAFAHDDYPLRLLLVLRVCNVLFDKERRINENALVLHDFYSLVHLCQFILCNSQLLAHCVELIASCGEVAS